MLGCGGLAEDSIEHYIHCKTVQKVADYYLKLGLSPLRVEHFMLSADRFAEDRDALTCMAFLIYAAYNATNFYRLGGGTDQDTAFDGIANNNSAMPSRATLRAQK